MAQEIKKRGPGRPPKDYTPVAKKLKTGSASFAVATPTTQSPAQGSPLPEKKTARLPAKVVDSKPLPTLSEPQSASLTNEEYQSIAASAVLANSLDRSRQRWIADGIFKRYWVKPEKLGKNAKPLPPDNPDPKRMKEKGECRIRIEPHIFVADVYVEERPKPPPQPKQYVQHQSSYGQQYGSSTGQPSALPQHNQSTHSKNAISQQAIAQTPTTASQRNTVSQNAQQTQRNLAATNATSIAHQNQKTGPDPVISMLASRASSDPELKALMKEVATGQANADQLRVFQRHIDELTAIIQKQKREEEDQRLKAQEQANNIQYEAPVGAKQAKNHNGAAATPTPLQQPIYTAPASSNLPVILEFKTAGATEDRFLFPEMSILESLSPQHELVSFIVIRKGREAMDNAGLEPETEYWQPVTLMIEVAYGREEILRCIQRWVKPADEVRKHMQSVMQRCQRAPQTYLALRLPFKSTAVAENDDTSMEATPILEEKTKPKSSVKYVKKAKSFAANKDSPAAAVVQADGAPAPATKTTTFDAAKDSAITKEGTTPGTVPGEEPEANETGRPRRAVRKSVRISEG